jgi:CRP-like cAMP-binding protein
MKEKSVKKGEILQHQGNFNTKAYHVKSGLLRSYSIDEKGKEHIFMFAPEGWIIGDSVASDEPADLFIDVLEDTRLVEISKNNDMKHSTDKLLKRMAVLQKRIIMLMSSSAIKRYEHFIETYPDITQRVPQRMIASYLGITPEALSAAKRKQFNKQ